MKKILLPLSLVFLVLLAFSPCLNGQFLHFDDDNHLVTNPLVYSFNWATLLKIFAQTVNDTYIPLTVLSYNIEYHVFGLLPGAYFLGNMLLHAGVVVLTYQLALALGLGTVAAWIASAFFALHPMRVESVAWATERKDVLYAFFYVWALLQYWRYLNTENKKNYVAALVLGLLSILSKPMAVSLPWILLVLDYYKGRHFDLNALLDKIPFAVIIFSFASITFITVPIHPTLVFPDSILIFIWCGAFHLIKFCWPYPLLPIYTPPEPVLITNPVFAFSIALAVLLGLSLFLFRRNRLWVMSCLFYVGSIFFLWRFEFELVNIVADRFMYLPSLGLCLFLGSYASRCLNNRNKRLITTTILCLVLGILGTLTFLQSRIWQNDISLWQWTLSHEPHNRMAQKKLNSALYEQRVKNIDPKVLKEPVDAKGYIERGIYFMQNDNPRIAIWDFNKAISLSPYNDMAFNNRAGFYQKKGEFQRALADYDHAIALNPREALHYLNKGITFVNMNKSKESLALFDKAITLNPQLKDAFYRRGLLLHEFDRCVEALEDFSAALRLEPYKSDYLYQRGLCYREIQDNEKAIADFKLILQLEPWDAQANNELGVIYLAQKNFKKALEVFTKATQINPYNPKPYSNIAMINLELLHYDEAIKAYNNAIRFDPTPYRTLISRGDLLAVMGQSAKAEADYTRAINMVKIDTLALLKRANLYYKKGKYKQALADIQRLLAQDPLNEGAHQGEVDILRAINRDR